MFVAYISATGRPCVSGCMYCNCRSALRAYRSPRLPSSVFFGLLPLHAVEGGVDEVAGTSNLSGSLEGTAGVALGDIVGWYFEPAGIMPPFNTHMASLQNAARKET